MNKIIGIDVGGSTTKIVGFDCSDVACSRMLSPMYVKASDQIASVYGAFGKFTTTNTIDISDVKKVMITGVGSQFIDNKLYGIDTCFLSEFECVGRGGLYISGYDKAIIVSMGTGTAYISVDGDKIMHEGGTGVGGGTLLGLANKMIGVRTFDNIIELAEKGNINNVNLTIGDISKNKISNMQGDITAANFGKISDVATHEDLALGIVTLVFEAIGMCAVFASREKALKNVVLTGNLSKNNIGRRTFDMLESIHDVKFTIPEKSDYATAIGAALAAK